MGPAGTTTAVPYFCLLYGVGNYLLVSLCVAVVSAGWSATHELDSIMEQAASTPPSPPPSPPPELLIGW